MISVLIPVFNRDVNELVMILSEQVKQLNMPAEIVVMDDGSDASFKILNNSLCEIDFVRYFESTTNQGRILARQRLAANAAYDWLLFLDCDSTIVSDRFLTRYCNEPMDNRVIVGGRTYASKKPTDCRFMLHWKYGANREITKAKNDGHINRFMTNNFFIHKSIFERLDFSGGWVGYGYEDSWMGIQLEAMNVPITFVDNPVMHDGVETSVVFIAKSEEALRNLKGLSKLVTPGLLAKHVRLYECYHWLRSWRLLTIPRLVYKIFRRTIDKNLHSCNPSLIAFDFYRLFYFVKVTED